MLESYQCPDPSWPIPPCRSDVLGHLLPAMGWDWSHAGISRLFTHIGRNAYQVGLVGCAALLSCCFPFQQLLSGYTQTECLMSSCLHVKPSVECSSPHAHPTHAPQLMYLSSRSISQASITRDYLATLVQGEFRMPVGPVIISPHGLLPSLYRWALEPRLGLLRPGLTGLALHST